MRPDHWPLLWYFRVSRPCNDGVEAVNACWAAGWHRTEVVVAVGAAISREKAEYDRTVQWERTPDAANAKLMTAIRDAVLPILSRTHKEIEEWAVRTACPQAAVKQGGLVQ